VCTPDCRDEEEDRCAQGRREQHQVTSVKHRAEDEALGETSFSSLNPAQRTGTQ
jgi:hypothetical protein